MKSMKGGSASGTSRTEKDLPMPFILGGILLIILIIWLAPAIPVSPLGALLIVIFGFFLALAGQFLQNRLSVLAVDHLLERLDILHGELPLLRIPLRT